MSNKTNVLTLCKIDNEEMRNEVEKCLKLPMIRIIKLLVAEKEAKKKAYLFIQKRGLMSDFDTFK